MYNMYDCLTVEELHLFFFCLCIFFDLAGFLLRAGNRLFLPAVSLKYLPKLSNECLSVQR